MITLKDIESAFEAKFAIDKNLEFRTRARGNRLGGQWAAQKLGLAGPEAEDYAKEVVVVEIESPGTDAVFRKVRADLDAKGIAQSDDQIRRALNEHLAAALAELKSGH